MDECVRPRAGSRKLKSWEALAYMKKILIIGGSGLLGINWAFRRVLDDVHILLHKRHIVIDKVTSHKVDFDDPGRLLDCLFTIHRTLSLMLLVTQMWMPVMKMLASPHKVIGTLQSAYQKSQQRLALVHSNFYRSSI